MERLAQDVEVLSILVEVKSSFVLILNLLLLADSIVHSKLRSQLRFLVRRRGWRIKSHPKLF